MKTIMCVNAYSYTYMQENTHVQPYEIYKAFKVACIHTSL